MSLSELGGLEDIRGESGFSHLFFQNLDEIRDNDFDNYILDVNVAYSVAAGRRYVSHLFADTDLSKDALASLDSSRFERKERGGRAVQEFSSTPLSRVNSVQELADSELYPPDITRDCLEASEEAIIDGEKVLQDFENDTSYLEVKEIMGIEVYSCDGLEATGNRDEDEAIIQAAEELEGLTCILTYDGDFITEDVHATIPEIASELRP